MVAEGVKTTFAALDLAASVGVELPITTQMGMVLNGGRGAADAIRELMDRAPKPE